MGTGRRDTRVVENTVLANSREQRSEISDAELLVKGLSAQDVAQRKNLFLANVVEDGSSRSFLSILRANTLTLFNAVVGGSFLLLLVLGQWKDALFGFAVIANMLIGIVQELSAKRTLDRIAILNQPRARVLRDSTEVEVDIADVVLDDLLILRAGEQVAADAHILVSTEFEADESLLTGESDPVLKSVGAELLSGSTVLAGNAMARVIRIGPESYSNRITREARLFSLVRSELKSAIARIIRWISWALIPLVAIALNGQMQAAGGWRQAWESGEWTGACVAAIASIISMVPQGLVLITSISFLLSAVTLARKQVLVQELPAVEGLARVDVVCFDKTGTLTEGEIRLDAIESLLTNSPVSIEDVLPGFAYSPSANATTRALRERFDAPPYPVSHNSEIVFSSSRKWSALEVDGIWWALGAPEMMVMTTPESAPMLERVEFLANSGMRVLLLARVHGELTETDALQSRQLTPAALITLSELIREDARQTVAYLREQGLELKVFSGDNPATVAAVAARAGIPLADRALDARLMPMEPELLAPLLEAHNVFGRVSPEQKKEFVLALQARGHVVAMTGDGVNDALALKTADLGVAMGNGAAATKAVSRIVLLNNSFASFPMLVGEGRRVIANVERVSRLFLTKTTWAMLLAVAFGLMLWSFPFLPRQLSAVDGYTIGIAAFFLAMLPNIRRYRPGFLKRSLMFCIPSGIAVGVSVVVLTVAIRAQTDAAAQTQTGVSILLSLTGLWVLVTLSRPYDRYRFAITGAMYALFVLAFTVGWVRDFFGFVVLTPSSLLATALVALVAIVVLEGTNFVVNRILKDEQD